MTRGVNCDPNIAFMTKAKNMGETNWESVLGFEHTPKGVEK